jgi:hypothetical protein
MGTPAYMSPEQAEGRLSDVDSRSDIYSLGATMYSVLLGRPPFQGQSTLEILRKVVSDPIPPPRQLQPDFPEDLERILLRALAKAPADRYPTAGALADDLALHFDRGRGTSPPTPVAAAPSGSRKTPLLVGAVLAAMIVAGVVFLQKPPAPPAPPADPPKDPIEVRPIRRPVAFPEAVPSKETFALKIAVHPFAEVVQATGDGKPVALESRVSPLFEAALPLADYDFVLRHPQLGERKVSVPRSMLSPGKTYVIWGRMENSELKVSESP